jgi:hypothetical protein
MFLPKFVKSTAVIAAIALIFGFDFACAQASDPVTPQIIEQQILSGIAEAKSDLKKGLLTIQYASPPAKEGVSVRAEILKTYGVVEQPVSDVLSLQGEAFRSAYNLIMQAAIQQKFGATFWQKVQSEVKTKSENVQFKLAPTH